ncbi:MAG: hypothetical protein IT364_16340 [Candidatus Hydrogenedentes bacterium]|nr:hypothetical protein [Candidatus Hydrogenedentota bacterium]
MDWNSVRTRQMLIAAAVVVFVYLFFLPWVWPTPEVTAQIPERATLGQDIEIPISVFAWHSNVDVYQVRFYVDYYASTAKGEGGITYPIMVLQRPPRQYRGVWGFNHLTRPWSDTVSVTVPLKKTAEERLLGAGLLSGKLDVSISYHPGRTPRNLPTENLARQTTISVPFSITLSGP